MTGSSDTHTIYNATDGPLAIDRAGRMLAARDRVEVDTLEGLSGHIDASRIVIVDTTPADEGDSSDESPRRARKSSASTSTQEA